MRFTFVETEVFTRRISRFRLEEDLRVLQVDLLQDPQAGALDPGTGGLRKVRMVPAFVGRVSEAEHGSITCSCPSYPGST
jgi:hypothetical protein